MFNRSMIKRSMASAVVIGAAALPSGAQAMFINSGGTPANPAGTARVAHVSAATTDSSFSWGDAGIGAAGAIVLLGAGALGTSVTRRHRRLLAS